MKEVTEAYDVGRRLGQGGYGTVYFAKRKTDGREACVKVLEISPDDPSGNSPFEREVKALRCVQHTNVVKMLRCGNGSCPWILLEYCSRGSLQGFIDRAKLTKKTQLSVEEDQVARWVKDVLSALGHLHSRGIKHRDVKPANVVVHASGMAKVCDFGVAASSEHPQQTHVGTTPYMAPQIVFEHGSEAAYNADDMFSVGVMVLEMFTLSRIPDAQVDRECDINKHLYIWHQGDPVSARTHEASLHRDVEATLDRRVSRLRSDAVSKLVVGCLYFSRDVRLSVNEAALLCDVCGTRPPTSPTSTARADDR